MIMSMHMHTSWRNIIKRVLSLPPHVEFRIPKRTVPSPEAVGFKETGLGDLKGARKQYRLRLPDGRSLHLRDYDQYYTIHWDEIDPELDPLGHLVKDAPDWLILLALLLIAGIGIGGGFLKDWLQ